MNKFTSSVTDCGTLCSLKHKHFVFDLALNKTRMKAMKDKWYKLLPPQFSSVFFSGNNSMEFLQFSEVFLLWLFSFFKELANEVENYIMRTFHNSFYMSSAQEELKCF